MKAEMLIGKGQPIRILGEGDFMRVTASHLATVTVSAS